MKVWIPVAILAAALTVTSAASARTDAAPPKAYVVAFVQSNGLPADAAQLVASAGGTVTTTLPQIGGLRVTSANPAFASTMLQSTEVAAVDLESWAQMIPHDDATGGAPPRSRGASAPAGMDPLYGQQWDKLRLDATPTGSYAVQRGRGNVVVAVLDSGADLTHPDVAPNLDLSRSRSFVPTEPDLQDHDGHGTWVLSAIAAPINGIGVSGIAPNVTTVALKVLDRNGRGSSTSVAQALVYAGQSHFDVVSMSIGVYLDSQADKADVTLVQRAVDFARRNGVLPIAALNNDNLDLSDNKVIWKTVELPADLDGVVGVSATGYANQKSYYSNYGSKETDVAAPGGDKRFQLPPAPFGGGGRLLGAWTAETAASLDPSLVEKDCEPGFGCATYAWAQGTSMAAPQAAGVAALIVSQYGRPHLSPSELESRLEDSAVPDACPSPPTVTYDLPPGLFAFTSATCKGKPDANNFYGAGVVNALRAVTAP
ncbi:MAG TPA: S8 family serine peptidase [Gaiellaceae bacterium]